MTTAVTLHQQNDPITFALPTPTQLTVSRLAQYAWAALTAPDSWMEWTAPNKTNA
jgi:hypothetical protein